MEVNDVKVEKGINVSVILQTLLLASTIGFGTMIVNSVDLLSEKVGMLTTSAAINANNITRNTADIVEIKAWRTKHIEECGNETQEGR